MAVSGDLDASAPARKQESHPPCHHVHHHHVVAPKQQNAKRIFLMLAVLTLLFLQFALSTSQMSFNLYSLLAADSSVEDQDESMTLLLVADAKTPSYDDDDNIIPIPDPHSSLTLDVTDLEEGALVEVDEFNDLGND